MIFKKISTAFYILGFILFGLILFLENKEIIRILLISIIISGLLGIVFCFIDCITEYLSMRKEGYNTIETEMNSFV